MSGVRASTSWLGSARRLLGGALLLVALAMAALAGAAPVAAADPAPAAISVSAPDTAIIGQEITVSAQLTSNGSPVTSRLLELLVDGTRLRNASVDANGRAEFPIRRGELTKAHTAVVTVAYPGSSALAPASASVSVVVRPARVTVETVPASDNVTLTLGSLQAVTKGGRAEFDVGQIGTYTLAMSTGSTVAPDVRADFVRWGDNVFTPKRALKVAGDVTLQLGLHVAYRQSFTFADNAGRPVDPASISSMTLTSTGGNELVLHHYADVWLGAGTAVKRATGLEVSPRNWRVLEVEISGTNVVNRGQQAIEPKPGSTASVEVLLFDLSIEAQDAVFGLPMTGSLSLVYPDGTVRNATFDSQTDTIHFDKLPRGDYTLRLSTHGLGAPTPVALSRDQRAVIRVISYLDIGVFVGLVLLGLAVLLWIGRRHQIVAVATRSQRLAQRSGSAARASMTASVPALLRGPLPRLRIRSLPLPRLHLPPVRLPSFRLPSFRLPSVTLPSWSRAETAAPAPATADAPQPAPAPPTLREVVSGTIDHRPIVREPAHLSVEPGSPTRPRSSRAGIPTRERARSAGNWWRSCPACRRRVSPQAGYCPSCGARVDA